MVAATPPTNPNQKGLTTMSNETYTSTTFPRRVSSGYYPEGHVQGIAIDEAGGYIYFSFTTILLKTDLAGNPVGSVCNIVGHLGCITFDPDRRRVYGSLELKHDAIGRGIVSRTGRELAEEDAFYCVSFDCDAITTMNMDAEVTDGEGRSVMTALYLPDVVRDYSETDEVSGKLHRYGCSGIDGTAYGPVFGESPDSAASPVRPMISAIATDAITSTVQIRLMIFHSFCQAQCLSAHIRTHDAYIKATKPEILLFYKISLDILCYFM